MLGLKLIMLVKGVLLSAINQQQARAYAEWRPEEN